MFTYIASHLPLLLFVVTLLIPAGAFGSVFPDSDSKSVPIGPELLFQVYFVANTHEDPYRNCEIFCNMNLHLDDFFQGRCEAKNGHIIEISFVCHTHCVRLFFHMWWNTLFIHFWKLGKMVCIARNAKIINLTGT